MEDLISQLGIDYRLLLSQAVNFLILLFILRKFVYQPLVNALNERQKKIREGLEKAAESERRLHEVNEIAKGRLKETDAEAMTILKRAEENAKQTEARLIREAEVKEAALLAAAERAAATKEKEAEERVRREAAAVVKAAIVKTVELSPRNVDDALIEKALREASKR